MLKDFEIQKAISIMRKWCEDNNLLESDRYGLEEDHFHIYEDKSIQIHFTNKEGIIYDVTINNGVGFRIDKREWGRGVTDEDIEKEQYWLYQLSPIPELNIDSFIVIQSWFAQNSEFTKFPDLRHILLYRDY